MYRRVRERMDVHEVWLYMRDGRTSLQRNRRSEGRAEDTNGFLAQALVRTAQSEGRKNKEENRGERS